MNEFGICLAEKEEFRRGSSPWQTKRRSLFVNELARISRSLSFLSSIRYETKVLVAAFLTR